MHLLTQLKRSSVYHYMRAVILAAMVMMTAASSLLAQEGPSQVCLNLLTSEKAVISSATVKEAEGVKVRLNGQVVAISEPVLNDNGTTLLSVRTLGKLLGTSITYNSQYKVATVVSGKVTLEIPLGYSFGVVNGSKKEIPNGKRSIVYKSTTYLPIRFVSEALGITINYSAADKVIDITTSAQAATDNSQVTFQFRKPEYLTEHFNEHGAEFGYETEEEYLAGANRVIGSSEALHKKEAEDGDDVYYIEATNEFVVVSTDGYIRTYFKPDDGIAYFNRQ